MLDRSEQGAEHTALQRDRSHNNHCALPAKVIDAEFCERRERKSTQPTARHGQTVRNAQLLVEEVNQNYEAREIGAAEGHSADHAKRADHDVDGGQEGAQSVHQAEHKSRDHYNHTAAELAGQAGRDRTAQE